MKLNEIIKGIIIGIAKVIPGLSGSVMMISFNLYEKAISAITDFFSNPKENIKFLLNLGLGILIGVVLFSKVILFFMTNYQIPTMFLFIGLIIGGIGEIKKNISNKKGNYLITMLSFLSMTILSLLNVEGEYLPKEFLIDSLVYFQSGVLEAIGTVIPGISSTALLMLMGTYTKYITTISSIFNLNLFIINLSFLLPFSVGLFIGFIVTTLLINYLIHYQKEKTFAFILGVTLSSSFTLAWQMLIKINNLKTLIVSLIFLILGSLIINKF